MKVLRSSHSLSRRTSRRTWWTAFSLILMASLVLSMNQAVAAKAVSPRPLTNQGPASHASNVTVVDALKVDRSPALRDQKPASALVARSTQPVAIPLGQLMKQSAAQAQVGSPVVDPALQNTQMLDAMPAPSIQFEGIGNTYGVAPPDTDGDIGPGYYVQWVNLGLEIWKIDRAAGTATPVYGPINGNALWKGFGGPCETMNNGDPVVLYDPMADRWFLSQFAVNGVNYQCIAVSATNDPTGAYYRYAYDWGGKMNDYPKFGVWPDGYYMTTNQFIGNDWGGAGVAVFERSQMLLGMPARMQKFDLYNVDSNFGGMLPADLDGTPPPPGTPNYFMEVDDSSFGLGTGDEMRIWEFKADWDDPSNSTFGLANDFGQPNQILPVSDYNPLCAGNQNCIAQKDTAQRLDAIGDRLMFRLAYRYFPSGSSGPYGSLVANHTVNVGTSSSARAGVRWYEVRKANGTFNIAQQGTFGGANPSTDALNRWMGSIAMDWQGNIALGYSLSGTTTYPAIGYAGRLSGDPAGTLPQAEKVFFTGPAYQSGVNRWGDYSSLSVDPVDECTFWYTQEYSKGSWDWATRVAAFKMPACAPQPRGAITGMVKNEAGDPIAGALLTAGPYTQVTGADGRYTFPRLEPGTYSLSAAAWGYTSQSAPDLTVTAGSSITQDFTLAGNKPTQVKISVFDGAGHPDWPLYARVEVITALKPTQLFHTDITTGTVNLNLFQGTDYILRVSADGYLPEERAVHYSSGSAEENFALAFVPSDPCPIGYVLTPSFYEGFEGGQVPPAGWSQYQQGDQNEGFAINNYSYTGQYSVYHDDANVYDKVNDVLVTPPITVSPGTFISFNERSIYPGYYYYHGLYATTGDNPDPSVSSYDEVQALPVQPDWHKTTVDLSAYAGKTIHVGLNYVGDYADEWYVDDVKVYRCEAVPGARVIGYVKDANTGLPLNGAAVASPVSASASGAYRDDAALGDGFYQSFVPLENPVLTASLPRYKTVQETLTVDPKVINRHDISLPAGKLSIDAAEISVDLEANGSPSTQPLTLQNVGGSALRFSLQEVNDTNPPFINNQPTGPFAPAHRHVGPKNLDKYSLKGVMSYMAPAPGPLSAEKAAVSWDTKLAYPWGIGYNPFTDDVWVGDLLLAGGQNLDHRFSMEGVDTGDAIDLTPWVGPSGWAADMAYNPITGKFWQVNVGSESDYCIYELDPQLKKETGNKICPPFSTSQRGLAYDPISNTFYSGSWDDGVINHFDENGVLLDSVDVALDIAGLAYNPVSHHLFVSNNYADYTDISVLDTQNNYGVVDSFEVSGVTDSKQGLDIDCQGRLWLVSSPKVFVTEPIEPGVCAWQDIPWLSEGPAANSLAPGGDAPVNLTFDPTGLPAGTYTAYLLVKNDTPYAPNVVKVTMNLSVPDYGAKLTPGMDAKMGLMGTWVSYPLNVTNIGVFSDSYTVSVSGNAWQTTLSNTSIGPLAPGASAQVEVKVFVPKQSLGTSDTVTVKLESRSSAGLVKTAALTTISAASVYLPFAHR